MNLLVQLVLFFLGRVFFCYLWAGFACYKSSNLIYFADSPKITVNRLISCKTDLFPAQKVHQFNKLTHTLSETSAFFFFKKQSKIFRINREYSVFNYCYFDQLFTNSSMPYILQFDAHAIYLYTVTCLVQEELNPYNLECFIDLFYVLV